MHNDRPASTRRTKSQTRRSHRNTTTESRPSRLGNRKRESLSMTTGSCIDRGSTLDLRTNTSLARSQRNLASGTLYTACSNTASENRQAPVSEAAPEGVEKNTTITPHEKANVRRQSPRMRCTHAHDPFSPSLWKWTRSGAPSCLLFEACCHVAAPRGQLALGICDQGSLEVRRC